ncbi:hypothetical protein ES703_71995 [subsurface metagenome]
MKCIWYWKWNIDPFDDERYNKFSQKAQKAIEENPDDFPTMSPGIHKGRGDGFRLVEGTYEQMMNLVAIWAPVEEWKLQVYFEADDLNKAGRKWHPDL